MQQHTKLHLGSGNTTPKGWVHVDGSWNAKLAKHPLIKKVFTAFRLLPRDLLDIEWSKDIIIHDLTKPLPFPDSSFTAIYSSHTLEHLYREDTLKLLHECYRVLKKNGIIRIVVPDLESIILEYMGRSRYAKTNLKHIDKPLGDRLQYRLMLRNSHSPQGNFLVRIYNTIKDYNVHRWMYDSGSLKSIIKEAGFSNLSKRNFHQSKIPGITKIEKSDRLEEGVGLCIEGVKK